MKDTEVMRRIRAIEAGHVWTNFYGCEEHVCVLDLRHDGPCVCECGNEQGRFYEIP